MGFLSCTIKAVFARSKQNSRIWTKTYAPKCKIAVLRGESKLKWFCEFVFSKNPQRRATFKLLPFDRITPTRIIAVARYSALPIGSPTNRVPISIATTGDR
jgi:hypothetical protein